MNRFGIELPAYCRSLLVRSVPVGGRGGRTRARWRAGTAVRGGWRRGSGLPICFWVGQAELGEEELGCGGAGDVAVPAGPGAAFEVVQAEGGLQFAVVVLDPPAGFGQADQVG
jgi:hypothetical protein